ncbi:HI1506-related protein [Serratia fonticola]|uniref:HI1506-related protein n=2 Tax=Serratia fonticola TaxID=47917 RepID=UPI00301D9909
MPVRITAKSEGFRRCGMEHASKPVTWPDDRFTPQQLEQLQVEPMLIVEVIGPDAANYPEAPTCHLPGAVGDLQSLYGEVKQRLLALGVEPEPVPTLESLIEQSDFATLQNLRHAFNDHLVGGGEVLELLALRDDINQELQALGYSDPVMSAVGADRAGTETGDPAAGDNMAAGDAVTEASRAEEKSTPPVKSDSNTAKTRGKGK